MTALRIADKKKKLRERKEEEGEWLVSIIYDINGPVIAESFVSVPVRCQRRDACSIEAV